MHRIRRAFVGGAAAFVLAALALWLMTGVNRPAPTPAGGPRGSKMAAGPAATQSPSKPSVSQAHQTKAGPAEPAPLAPPGTFTTPKMVRKATLIVTGRVVSTKVVKEAGEIYTIAILDIDGKLKGEASPTVSIKMPGGTLGGITRILIGAPTFQVRDDILVFLKPRDPGYFTVYGLSLGHLLIRRDASGRRYVSDVPDAPGRVLLDDYVRKIKEVAARG